jgi:hypothetical protein
VKHVLVRYKLKPDQVEANEALVRAVYDELAERTPGGFRYGTFKLDDGLTFVHVAEHDAENPLREVAAFQRFQEGIGERCDEAPVVHQVEVIGSYRLVEDDR